MDTFIFLALVFLSVSVSNAQLIGHGSHGTHGQASTGTVTCRPGWDLISDPETGHVTCLWFSDIEATFTDAWAWCTMLTSHPTAVFSYSMQQQISASSKLRKKGPWWLGFTDMESRGRYKLVYNGEPVVYFSSRPNVWLPGKPSSSLQNRCVYLDNDKSQLSDDVCTATHRFICQDHY